MNKFFSKINFISIIIFLFISISVLAAVFVLGYILPYKNVCEVILCFSLMFIGSIYVAFSFYDVYVYKSGITGVLLGLLSTAMGIAELMNIVLLNGWNNNIFFIVIVSMLLLMLFKGVQIVVKLVDNNQKLKQKEQMLQASIALTKSSQIKSHFIFNVLNAISAMCKQNPEKADEAVVRFSRILRTNMEVMEEDKLVPFNDAIEQLDNYVFLEKIRFEDKFVFRKEIEFSNFKFPLLILQPLIENSIKHGISSKKGGVVVLKSWKDIDNVYIEIIDNGIGFDLKDLEMKESIGLKNIKFRLSHMVNGELKIYSEPSKGTKVKITIPYKGDN